MRRVCTCCGRVMPQHRRAKKRYCGRVCSRMESRIKLDRKAQAQGQRRGGG